MARKPVKPPTAVLIQQVHPAFAPLVAQFVNVADLKVTYVNSGASGYSAYSGPAAGTIEYNTYYNGYSEASWKTIVAHEVGGHHDVWHQLVRDVGLTKAWTDYYDIDTYAKEFFENRWWEMFGAAKTFSLVLAKECYLDLRGSVRMGLPGAYLRSIGLATFAQQQQFGQGSEVIYSRAVA